MKYHFWKAYWKTVLWLEGLRGKRESLDLPHVSYKFTYHASNLIDLNNDIRVFRIQNDKS